MTEVIDLPGVRCEVASPEMVLVLKCLAHRTGEDDDDVLLLARAAGLAGPDAVLALVERTVGDRSLLTPAVEFFVRAVLAE